MVSDEELIRRLKEILDSADLNVTTEKIIRNQLEREFQIDLSERRKFVRHHVQSYLNSQQDLTPENRETIGTVNDNGTNGVATDYQAAEASTKVEPSENLKDKKRKAPPPSKSGKDKKSKSGKEENGRPVTGGLSRLCALSEPLADLLGHLQLPRTEVVREMWNYIKANSLQKEGNRKVIVCDEKLKRVFGVDETDMFKMNKLLSVHLTQIPGSNPTNGKISNSAPPSASTLSPSTPSGREVKEEGGVEEGGEPAGAPGSVKPGAKSVSGINAPLLLSPELRSFLSCDETTLARPEVVKRMWAYIREKGLQDPKDKRRIICDAPMAKLLNVDTFNGFGMTKFLSSHFFKLDGTSPSASSLPPSLSPPPSTSPALPENGPSTIGSKPEAVSSESTVPEPVSGSNTPAITSTTTSSNIHYNNNNNGTNNAGWGSPPASASQELPYAQENLSASHADQFPNQLPNRFANQFPDRFPNQDQLPSQFASPYNNDALSPDNQPMSNNNTNNNTTNNSNNTAINYSNNYNGRAAGASTATGTTFSQSVDNNFRGINQFYQHGVDSGRSAREQNYGGLTSASSSQGLSHPQYTVPGTSVPNQKSDYPPSQAVTESSQQNLNAGSASNLGFNPYGDQGGGLYSNGQFLGGQGVHFHQGMGGRSQNSYQQLQQHQHQHGGGAHSQGAYQHAQQIHGQQQQYISAAHAPGGLVGLGNNGFQGAHNGDFHHYAAEHTSEGGSHAPHQNGGAFYGAGAGGFNMHRF